MRVLICGICLSAVVACAPAVPVVQAPTETPAAAPAPTARATPDPLGEPTAVPAPPSTRDPAFEPAPEPTPEPIADPIPEPVEQALAEPGPPTAADDVQALAAQIAAAEATIRDPSAAPAGVARAGWTAQVAYRHLARRPEWREAVMGAVDPGLHTSVQRNADAAAELMAMITPRTPEQGLPAWRIVEPAPAEELLGYYREAEATFGVPWSYLAAIHLVETRMGRIRGTSTAGAQGPMQFMPGTWDAYGEGDVNDNRDAILAAGRYLRASGAPGNMPQALFRYNRDQRYVRAITRYAQEMTADERAFHGYHAWEVYYLTTGGDLHLPVGWEGA
jgi:hypothetical protein